MSDLIKIVEAMAKLTEQVALQSARICSLECDLHALVGATWAEITRDTGDPAEVMTRLEADAAAVRRITIHGIAATDPTYPAVLESSPSSFVFLRGTERPNPEND